MKAMNNQVANNNFLLFFVFIVLFPEPSFSYYDSNGSYYDDNYVQNFNEQKSVIPTRSASFNCSNAKKTLEILICADAELSSLDGQVADVYLKVKSAAEKNESDKILKEQREFLKQRIKACPIPLSEQISEVEANSVISCLKEFYTTRLYLLSKYVVNKDQKNIVTDDKPVVAQSSQTQESSVINKSDASKEEDSGNGFYYVLLLIICYFAWRIKSNKDKKRLAIEQLKAREEKISKIINKHILTLSIKRKQLSVADEYGVVDPKPWLKEVSRFHDTVLFPALGGECIGILYKIENKIINYENNNVPKHIKFSEAMNPYDYERYCADLLLEIGWNAYATKGSGDQGSDVIALRDGLKIVIQCKLYSQPVGNKAIQEVFAAKCHEQADYAVVVTNQTFTKSARQIASTTGVTLLHHQQLQKWAESISV